MLAGESKPILNSDAMSRTLEKLQQTLSDLSKIRKILSWWLGSHGTYYNLFNKPKNPRGIVSTIRQQSWNIILVIPLLANCRNIGPNNQVFVVSLRQMAQVYRTHEHRKLCVITRNIGTWGRSKDQQPLTAFRRDNAFKHRPPLRMRYS